MPKLTKLIQADHRYTEGLLAQLTADPAAVTYDDAARDNLANYLVAACSRHEAAEELVVWPAVHKRVTGGAALIAEGLRQEKEAKYALDALRFASGARQQQLAAEVAALLRAHIVFEERKVLPALRRATIWPGLHWFGLEFVLAKRVGPTRPHPRGPVRRYGLLTRGMLAAVTDRLRDRFMSRET